MGTITGTAGPDILNGTSGDDTIYGLGGNDTLNGGAGHDILIGGPGADILNGGPDSDIYRDTAANFNGDEITNLKMGDEIQITDLDLSHGSIGLVGNVINYNNNGVAGSITVDNIGPGRLVLRLPSTGGVDLRLQHDAYSDFNGDGRSDVLLQSTSGAISVWRGQADGSFVDAGNLAANPVDSSWKVAGIGDFNGDGREDILWRHTSGTIAEWTGQSGAFVNNSGVAANPVDNSWSVVGVADYNGDGRDDILWRHTSGEIGQWLAQPDGSFSNNGGAAANLVDNSWTVVASGDFNGDGTADILWRHTSGVFAEWDGSSTGKLVNIGAVMSGATGSVVGSGDFNGDGRDDILMRDSSTGTLTVWLAQADGQFTSFTPTSQVHDLNWKVVGIGDYNGDGSADLLWQHSSGVTTEWLATGTGDFVNHGFAPDVPAGFAVQSPDLWLV